MTVQKMKYEQPKIIAEFELAVSAGSGPVPGPIVTPEMPGFLDLENPFNLDQ